VASAGAIIHPAFPADVALGEVAPVKAIAPALLIGRADAVKLQVKPISTSPALMAAKFAVSRSGPVPTVIKATDRERLIARNMAG
jgi:hypothetical protein